MQEPLAQLTLGYPALLEDLKARIRSARQKAALSVNRELILLHWELGRRILESQGQEGWGAKIVDRLAADLRKAFPEMTGFSPRNLLFMRSLAEAFPDVQIVKQLVSQIPWGHLIRILQTTKAPAEREFYIRQTIANGWSRAVLVHQIESGLFHRQGKALNNVRLRCYVVVELKVGEFQPEHAGKMLFYLAAVDDLLRHPDDQPSIGLILCKVQNRLVAEYTLRGAQRPLGVATYQMMPEPLRDALPSPAEIEAILALPPAGAAPS